eukprot:c25121_g1_i1 orf=220-1299(+)
MLPNVAPLELRLFLHASVRRLSTCRSIVLPRFGGPDVLELCLNDPLPDLRPSEVLVRTRATAVNPLDIRMREGYGRSLFEPLLPLILGRDVSGEVTAVGNGVKQLELGQEVFGALHPTAVRGTYSEYAILLDEQLAPKPPSLTHVEAAAIPFSALAAWRALRSTAKIKSGQKVLVLGGGGAVGMAAIQLAKAADCQVICTCGKRSMDAVVKAGAEQAFDYTLENLKEHLKGKFDAVLDTIGLQETEALGIGLLKKGGHYMTLQGQAVKLTDEYGLIIGGAAAIATLLKKQMQYKQSHGIKYWWTTMRTDFEGLEEIARLAKDSKLYIPVGQSFPFTEAAVAHRVRDGKQVHGKIVLEVE